MNHHDTSTAAQPQAAGDPRPFCHIRATGPTRVHVEKSGPAFIPVPVADALGLSLVRQSVKATGDVLYALAECKMLDWTQGGRAYPGLAAAWATLLRMQDLHLPLARTHVRQNWEWYEMRDAVQLALISVGEPHAFHPWLKADGLIRGYAMTCALGAESRLDIETGEEWTRLAHRAMAYRAFAEGRS